MLESDVSVVFPGKQSGGSARTTKRQQNKQREAGAAEYAQAAGATRTKQGRAEEQDKKSDKPEDPQENGTVKGRYDYP